MMTSHSRFLPVTLAMALLLGFGVSFASGQIALPSAGNIATVAGNGTPGYKGDGGAATAAELNMPAEVAVDKAGNLYIADSGNNVIRKVTVATGQITTVAGGGQGSGVSGTPTGGNPNYSGDGGPATSAALNTPVGVAFDSAGNLYIADYGNNVIRKVTAATGIITTVAGKGGYNGYSGDGGPATSALLFGPYSVGVDGAGNLYIADLANYVIRKVTAATGFISTYVGTGTRGYTGNGGPAARAEINLPSGIALDTAGNLYFTDSGNCVLQKVAAATGIITTVAGFGGPLSTGDGGPASSAGFIDPYSVAVDGQGNLYVADYADQRVRKITAATGIITTIAGNSTMGYTGDGGPATHAELNNPYGVAVDSQANVYISVPGQIYYPNIPGNMIRVVGGGQTVAPATYNVSVKSSNATPMLGTSIMLTATVTSSLQQPVSSGTVTWTDGATVLGQGSVDINGVATLSTTVTMSGTQVITASYAGLGTASGTTSLAVIGYTLAGANASGATISITAGHSGQFVMNVAAANGYTGTLALSCSGMPSPGSCSLSPSSVTLTSSTTSQQATLTVQTEAKTSSAIQAPNRFTAMTGGFALAILCPLWIAGRRNLRLQGRVSLAVVMAALLGMGVAGCSGGGGPGAQAPSSPALATVPPGTYTVNVVAQAGSNTVSLPVTVTVQ